MNKQILNSAFLILITFFILNATFERKTLTANLIEKSVAKITDDLYAGKFEVSNWLYRQFLIDLKVNHRSADLKVAQIDSAGWLAKPIFNEPFVRSYHTDEKCDDFPVVNISVEAANLFCNWLTEKYNSFPDKKLKSAKFILPDEQEWILAAKGGRMNSVYSSGNSLKNDKGMFMCNFQQDGSKFVENVPNISPDILAPVLSYWGNDLGIYNMSGNAAEMISTKGVTKGGSFKTNEDALKLDAKGNYKGSASDIGFRYFIKIAH